MRYPIPRDVVTPCAKNPELYFSDTRTSPQRVEAAKNVCGTCPFRDPCAAWAIVHDEQGVWGQTDDTDRRRYRRAHGIVPQRPPLADYLRETRTGTVSHGTDQGIAYHKRVYGPLCQRCTQYEDKRKRRAS